MVNLYEGPLRFLQYSDVLAFLTEAPRPREGLTLEFKETWADSLPFDIAALANTEGGIILVGVKDAQKEAGAPVGVPLRSIESGTLTNLCHMGLRPAYVPEWHAVTIPGTDRAIVVLRVDVKTAPRPIWTPEKGVLVRLDDQCRPADVDTLRRLLDPSTGLSATDQDFVRLAGAAPGRNGAGSAWLSVVVKFPVPFVMTSSWKKRFVKLASRLFNCDPEAMTRRILGTFAGCSIDDPASPTHLDAYGPGIVDWVRALPGDPVLLRMVFKNLIEFFSHVVRSDLFTEKPEAVIAAVMTISNVPPGGIVPDSLLELTPLGNSRPWGNAYQQTVTLTPGDWVESVCDFCGLLLNEMGYVDYEGPVNSLKRAPSELIQWVNQ